MSNLFAPDCVRALGGVSPARSSSAGGLGRFPGLPFRLPPQSSHSSSSSFDRCVLYLVRPPSPQRPSPAYGSVPPLPRGLALYPVDPLPANLCHRHTPPLLASAEGVGDRGFGMGSLEDLGSVGHALSALRYGRDTAACCAAEIAVHACERVSQSTQGELVLFLMAAPASGRSAVVLYGGQHAEQCDDSEQINIATGLRLIMGSLRTAAAPPALDPTGASLTPPDSPIAADLCGVSSRRRIRSRRDGSLIGLVYATRRFGRPPTCGRPTALAFITAASPVCCIPAIAADGTGGRDAPADGVLPRFAHLFAHGWCRLCHRPCHVGRYRK